MEMPGDYLKTARVLVVDDHTKEALPIMLALGMYGIGYIYLEGVNVEELPKTPFKGIRLVFLDLQLGEGGDPNIFLSKTVSVLKRLISPDTMPLLIICWTKHEEDIQQFSEMAMDAIPGLKPGFIEKMPKPKTNVESWKELWPDIIKIIEQYTAVRILWDWEQVVHEAITDTTQALADVVTKNITDDKNCTFNDRWQSNLLKVLQTLVEAETGKTATKDTAPGALFNALNTLVSDRLSHNISNKKIPYSNVICPQCNDESISDDEKATLNQMILTEPIHSADLTVKPGYIYLRDEKLREKCLHTIFNLDYKKLVDQMLEMKIDGSYVKQLTDEKRKIEEELKSKPDDKLNERLKEIEGEIKEKQSDNQLIDKKRKIEEELKSKPDDKLNERLKEIEGEIIEKLCLSCIAILLEISPLCDYSQNKRPVSRFIAGILVPETYKKCKRKGPFMHELPPLFLYGHDGKLWAPIFNSRFQFGLPEELVQNKPLCRIRPQALIDIQAWAASQASRPGKLSIT